MELEILHWIQNLHTDWLDPIMIFVTTLGEGGIIWCALALVLLFFPKTRRCGKLMVAVMMFSFLLGNLILKNIIARGRPFTVDTTVSLLIKEPGEYSFPSGHTLNGFSAATMLFLHYRGPGIAAFVLAGIIAFSRMYLFVHYPTDILGGLILGVVDALVIYLIAARRFPVENKAGQTAGQG
ncbi:MAG: phosphatase PAP2 family protein [Lachnospiraceae bacterium]|nr:phosphatase PAP2 family protein [Lachnospiraceae bacterium]